MDGANREMRDHQVLDIMLEGCQIIGFDWSYRYVNNAVVGQSGKTREELLGNKMMEVFPGIDETPMFAALRRCMEARESYDLENEFTFPDGTKGWFELRMEPVPEGVFILSIDITARKRAERETKLQLARLRSLRTIDLAILGTTDMHLALKNVLEETLRRLQADIVIVYLFNPATLLLEAAGTIGHKNRAVEHTRLHLGRAAAGQAALERRTIAASNLVEGDPVAASIPQVFKEEGVKSLFAVPLVAKGNLFGVLELAKREPFNPDSEWLEFLEALAGQAAMAIDIGKSFENLQHSYIELALAYDTTLEGWSHALELRDNDTEGHCRRVADATMEMAIESGMTGAELAHVRRGALLHDIGKMGIPDVILLKPDKLTDEEMEIMRRHPQYAYDMLSSIAFLKPALDIPYCHHEKWDGSGYPRGLKGELIPLPARLFAIVDVWDALRSERPYRQAWPDDKVRDYIRAQSGTHFEPGSVEVFSRLLSESRIGVL